MTRVLILAPNIFIRIGLRQVLSDLHEVMVVGEASSVDELARMDTEAEIILMASASVDWFEPDSNFQPTQAILLLSDDVELGKALMGCGGLWGILPPTPSPEELSAGIQAMRQGLAVFPSRWTESLWQISERQHLDLSESLADPLTRREVEILGLIAQGLANKQIAARLSISEHTVKFHLSSVYAKLGANSRTEAVRLGTLQGLIII